MMNFPLDLRFKLIALNPQVFVTDAAGTLICYVRQQAFKLKEAVTIFSDAAQTVPLYTIKADRILDLSAQYHIADVAGAPLGTLGRRGLRSLWRAHYEIQRGGQLAFTVREENPWIKVIDGVLGEIPVLGLLTGYVFHPAYRVSRAEGDAPVLRAVKRPAFLEGRYTLERTGALDDGEERLAVLSVLMMLLLERSRG
ncbi:MAG: hypothetical protein WKG32_16030 [Gemmatimonadaceae bacterium]